MAAMGGIRTALLVVISLQATGCGGDDSGGGRGGADGGPANVTELPGLVPDDIAVPLPDSVQSSRRLAGCFMTAAEQQFEELVAHVERTHGHALAQLRFVDLMVGAVAGGAGDATYSEAGDFTIEVTDELAARVAADVADYPELAEIGPPAGFIFASPRFCHLKNRPGEFSNAFYLDRYDFAAGAGCDDLDNYMTSFEWNDDRTRFRIRVSLYRNFWPNPHFNYYYDETNPIPEGAGDVIDGYITYTFDSALGREWYRLSTLQNYPDSEYPAEIDGLYELTGTMEECGADECLRFHLVNDVIGNSYDRVEIFAGQADAGGAIIGATESQREGALGGVIFTDDQVILDADGCRQFERNLEADGYTEWRGDGTGDPTEAPFYQEVVLDGIDFNGAVIDFSGLSELPDSDDDLPRLLVIARGGADPASDPNAHIGVGYAHHIFDTLFTRYVYWGTPADVPDAEVYEHDWDADAQASTYAAIPGSLAIAP
jgi:hypothetical protein